MNQLITALTWLGWDIPWVTRRENPVRVSDKELESVVLAWERAREEALAQDGMQIRSNDTFKQHSRRVNRAAFRRLFDRGMIGLWGISLESNGQNPLGIP